jgi:hypothetical protein
MMGRVDAIIGSAKLPPVTSRVAERLHAGVAAVKRSRDDQTRTHGLDPITEALPTAAPDPADYSGSSAAETIREVRRGRAAGVRRPEACEQLPLGVKSVAIVLNAPCDF